LVIAPQGPGALLKLGLRQGDLRTAAPPALVEKTILRAGDSFDVAINGGTARTIRIDGDDTMAALAIKIRAQLGSTATVTVQENTGGTKISITAKSTTRIDLRRGPEGADLLGKIGIAPGQLRDGTTLFDIGKSAVDVARTPGGAFALNLDRGATLADAASSGAALGKIDAALQSVQRAYRSLYYDPTREALARERAVTGPVPAYLTQQLSNYQDALARLQVGNSNFGFRS
jgi:trimeric autotransporter adhesin